MPPTPDHRKWIVSFALALGFVSTGAFLIPLQFIVNAARLSNNKRRHPPFFQKKVMSVLAIIGIVLALILLVVSYYADVKA